MKKRKTQCSKCGYKWETASEMYLVSCPSCGRKVKIKVLKKTKDALNVDSEVRV